MDITAAAVCGVVGLFVGAWLQVVVARTPMRERVLGVILHCSTCGTSLVGSTRYSLAAYLTRKNQCGICKQKIWSKLPWLELTTCGVLAFVGATLGWAWALPAYVVVFAAFIAITLVDVRHYLIPNRIIYPTFFACLFTFLVAAVIDDSSERLLHALIGMAGAGTFFFLVWIIRPSGMGMGDIRLAVVIGLVTGWIGVGNTLIAMFLGTFSAAIIGLLFVALRFLTHRDPIPYGPFLILGAAVSILWGEQIGNWWMA